MSAALQLVEKSKECAACGEVKSVTEFYLRKDRVNQFTSYCKPCLVVHKRKSNKIFEAHEQIIPEEQKCSKCKEIKVIGEFQKCNYLKTGHLKYCKSCVADNGKKRNRKIQENPIARLEYNEQQNKKYNKDDTKKKKAYARFVSTKYGVTIDVIKQTIKNQINMCANRGCGQEINLDVSVGHPNRAVVDHCHTTGKFRAVLCQKCNLALGHLEENCNRALGLVEYINQHKEA